MTFLDNAIYLHNAIIIVNSNYLQLGNMPVGMLCVFCSKLNFATSEDQCTLGM